MYQITYAAEQHLLGIGATTRETLGDDQAKSYLSALVSKFELLAENPKIGRTREELYSGLRSFLEGSHVIFYLIQKNSISIIAVLNQKQDSTSFFSDNKNPSF